MTVLTLPWHQPPEMSWLFERRLQVNPNEARRGCLQPSFPLRQNASGRPLNSPRSGRHRWQMLLYFSPHLVCYKPYAGLLAEHQKRWAITWIRRNGIDFHLWTIRERMANACGKTSRNTSASLKIIEKVQVLRWTQSFKISKRTVNPAYVYLE